MINAAPAPADVDVTEFPAFAAIDTCAVWNILSSRVLFQAASRKRRSFIVCDFVKYECLFKHRSAPCTAEEQKMRDQLTHCLANSNCFSSMQLSVSDLREVANLAAIKQLGSGELASLVVAQKLRAGFITDDRAARKLGKRAFPEMKIRTTPHLVGWLAYEREITDSEVSTLIAEHDAASGSSSLKPFMHACYLQAVQCLSRAVKL